MPVFLSFDVGIKNLAFCLIEGTRESHRILKWDILDIQERDLERMSSKLIHMLYDLFADVPIFQVLIENQPVMKNPTMKSIQMIIHSFFICSREIGMNSVERVSFVPASCKNKFCDGMLRDEEDNSKPSYTRNKKRAIQTTRMLVPVDWKTYFESHKKKDDLADAFLQALCKM